MKKFLKLFIFYAVGMACVYTMVWRASDIDQKTNNTLANRYEVSNSYNN